MCACVALTLQIAYSFRGIVEVIQRARLKKSSVLHRSSYARGWRGGAGGGLERRGKKKKKGSEQSEP